MGELCMLNGLRVGEYKNYKELCEALNWGLTSGNSKIAQFKTLDTLCKWHKEGNKIVVTEIYTEPKEKIDNRVNNGNKGHNTSKYSTIVYDNLIELLRDNKRDYHISTLNKLMQGLGLITIGGKKYLDEYEETKTIDVNTIKNDVRNDITIRSKSIIETALNRLQKNNVINSWDYTYCICGKECSDKQKEIIQQTEKRVLNKYFNLDNKGKHILYITNRYKLFSDIVECYLKKDYHLKYNYYMGYVINYDKKQLKDIETNVDKKALNSLIVESCLNSANNRHTKAKSKRTIIGIFKPEKNDDVEAIRAHKKYINICTKIINKAIKIKD